MKIVIMLIFSICQSIFCFLNAQSLEKYVVSSAGDLYTTNNLIIEWTIGEVMIESYSVGQLEIFQGLHQPFYDLPEPPSGNLHLTNFEVIHGLDTCFSAPDTIFVAGDNNMVTVYNGGALNLVAGKVIRLFYGFSVQHGGNFNAWIDTTGTFCGQKESTLLASLGSNDLTGQIDPFAPDNNGEGLLFKAYPNPTNGSFTVELMFDCESPAIVEIFTIMGNLIMKTGSSGKKLIVCDLTGKQAGVYIVRVSNQERTGQKKIIKNN
jgi:hypothetical protein